MDEVVSLRDLSCRDTPLTFKKKLEVALAISKLAADWEQHKEWHKEVYPTALFVNLGTEPGARLYYHQDQPSSPISYWAPEILEGDKYTCASNVYSIAIILWELFFAEGTEYRVQGKLTEIVCKVSSGVRPLFPQQMDGRMQRICHQLQLAWDGAPGKRGSGRDLRTFFEEELERHTL